MTPEKRRRNPNASAGDSILVQFVSKPGEIDPDTDTRPRYGRPDRSPSHPPADDTPPPADPAK